MKNWSTNTRIKEVRPKQRGRKPQQREVESQPKITNQFSWINMKCAMKHFKTKRLESNEISQKTTKNRTSTFERYYGINNLGFREWLLQGCLTWRPEPQPHIPNKKWQNKNTF